MNNSLARYLLIGAIAGAALLFAAQSLPGNGSIPADPAGLFGYILGGAAVGALIGGIVHRFAVRK